MIGRRSVIAVLVVLAGVAFLLANDSKNMAGGSPPLNDARGELSQSASTTPLEGCLKGHDKIEPMHRFGPTATLDKLDNGKDALGLTCTGCHGGNPAVTTKEEAHVRPRYPSEWIKNGKFRIPERSGPLLARESL